MIALLYAWWTRLFAGRCPKCGGYDYVGTGYYTERCRTCNATWTWDHADR